jgi:hypothetical protein
VLDVELGNAISLGDDVRIRPNDTSTAFIPRCYFITVVGMTTLLANINQYRLSRILFNHGKQTTQRRGG